MIESSLATGDTGLLIVQDNTDGTDKTVNLYIQSTSTIRINQLPWTYSLDGVMQPWRSFNFSDSVLRQSLGLIFVGYTAEFTLHLGDTATTQMGGPTDLTVQLNQHGSRTASILVDGIWRKAVPFVNVGGVWKAAAAYVMKETTWKESS